MDLSVIIVNFNTKELLRDCLESLWHQTKGIDYEVIVVDNGSTDGSVEEMQNSHLFGGRAKLKTIFNKKNLGFARANNQGIKMAQGEYILLLNSDTKLVDDALTKLVKFAKTKKDLGIVGPKLLNADGSPQPSVAPFYTLPITAISLFRGDRFLRRSPSKSCQVDWVSGACFLIKRELIEKIGLLDENFFMYVEEMEYCFRAKKAGFETWFYPQARVYHLVRGSSPKGRQRVIWWIYQGLLYFYRRHFAPWQVFVLKFLLGSKALMAWWLGIVTANEYLKKTYRKAFAIALRG